MNPQTQEGQKEIAEKLGQACMAARTKLAKKERRTISQAEVAVRARIGTRTYQRIEKGDLPLTTLAVLFPVAQALETTPSALLK